MTLHPQVVIDPEKIRLRMGQGHVKCHSLYLQTTLGVAIILSCRVTAANQRDASTRGRGLIHDLPTNAQAL